MCTVAVGIITSCHVILISPEPSTDKAFKKYSCQVGCNEIVSDRSRITCYGNFSAWAGWKFSSNHADS